MVFIAGNSHWIHVDNSPLLTYNVDIQNNHQEPNGRNGSGGTGRWQQRKGKGIKKS